MVGMNPSICITADRGCYQHQPISRYIAGSYINGECIIWMLRVPFVNGCNKSSFMGRSINRKSITYTTNEGRTYRLIRWNIFIGFSKFRAVFGNICLADRENDILDKLVTRKEDVSEKGTVRWERVWPLNASLSLFSQHISLRTLKVNLCGNISANSRRIPHIFHNKPNSNISSLFVEFKSTSDVHADSNPWSLSGKQGFFRNFCGFFGGIGCSCQKNKLDNGACDQ